MTITPGALLIMLIISVLVGVAGEFLAHRRAPFGIVGASILGFAAIFLVTAVLNWHIDGEPYLNGVPVITSILAAAALVIIWSAIAYRHAYGYASRYYRRSGFMRRFRRW